MSDNVVPLDAAAQAMFERLQQKCRENRVSPPYIQTFSEEQLREYARVQSERDEQLRRERMQENVLNMRVLLPERYRDAEITTPLPDGSLYLVGPAGTGKTHAAAATALTAAATGTRIAWLNVPAYLASIRDSFNGGDPVPPPASLVSRVQLVVLDDLGVEKPSDWTRETLYALINEIYERELRLIITSNVPPSQLVQALGERAVSRIIGECRVLNITGADRRRVQARERQKAASDA